MRLKQQWWSGLVAAVLGGLVGVTAVAAAGEQFIPILGYREGALKALGISMTNGFIDYVTLLNERVVSLTAADNVPGPLSTHLRRAYQPAISKRNLFSPPRPSLLASI